MKRICVYCGSNAGAKPEYLATARSLGEAIARRGLGLVYGGASVGLMGAVADAALAAGGEVIGIIPQGLVDRELAHGRLSQLEVVSSMHQRKARMAELSDAFIALPGGFGTLEELFETLTWAMLGIHKKPCGILDVGDYYASLVQFLDRAVDQGFLRAPFRALLHHHVSPNDLLDALTTATPIVTPKWLSPSET